MNLYGPNGDESDLDDLEAIALIAANHGFDGGYPAQCQWVENSLVVCSVDHDGAPFIDVYSRQAMIEWQSRARQAAIEEPDEDSEYWICETAPEQAIGGGDAA